MGGYLEILEHELNAGDGSFLIKLRCDLEWDRAAFTRLTDAMKQCCEELAGAEVIDRWLAGGFWYLSFFVKDWTTHPNFPKKEPDDYYAKAYERLDSLAYWFFMGESPYEGAQGFEPL